MDIDASSIDVAKKGARLVGRKNVEFVTGNARDCVRNPREYGVSGKIDALILYAVFEHLTPRERQDVLMLCVQVLNDGGLVVLGETPNRLIPHDSHSTFLHFFQTLPPEIALQYIIRSPRPGAADTVNNSEECLYRFGQAASYHEFDLWMRDETGRLPGIVSDGWSYWAAAEFWRGKAG